MIAIIFSNETRLFHLIFIALKKKKRGKIKLTKKKPNSLKKCCWHFRTHELCSCNPFSHSADSSPLRVACTQKRQWLKKSELSMVVLGCILYKRIKYTTYGYVCARLMAMMTITFVRWHTPTAATHNPEYYIVTTITVVAFNCFSFFSLAFFC